MGLRPINDNTTKPLLYASQYSTHNKLRRVTRQMITLHPWWPIDAHTLGYDTVKQYGRVFLQKTSSIVNSVIYVPVKISGFVQVLKTHKSFWFRMRITPILRQAVRPTHPHLPTLGIWLKWYPVNLRLLALKPVILFWSWSRDDTLSVIYSLSAFFMSPVLIDLLKFLKIWQTGNLAMRPNIVLAPNDLTRDTRIGHYQLQELTRWTLSFTFNCLLAAQHAALYW
jgi:hypothetical protein